MEKGQTTRARILDTAMGMVSRDGLAALSIGKLAAALAMSKSGLIAHFGTKEALQCAVLDYTSARDTRQVMAPVAALSDPRARLRALMNGCLDWIDDPAFAGGCPIIVACFELAGQQGLPWDNLVAMQHGFVARLTNMFLAAAGQGANIDAAQMAFEFRAITLMYQHASRVLADPAARTKALCMFKGVMARLG